MRDVSVDRFVPAPPAEVAQALTPAAVVEYVGTLNVLEIDDAEADGATLVTAGASGVGARYRFDSREDGLSYEQVGDEGPFDEMWTEITWEPENEGSRVTATSGVSLGLPVAGVTDRVAAWKRRGELERALRNLADDLS